MTVAVDANERVQAFADWLPVPARRGWVIDLMRRREDAMTAVMESLIGVSLLTFKEHFRPHWEGTYLAYRSSANLPAISVALLHCYLPAFGAGDLARLADSPIARRLAPGEEGATAS